MVDTEEVRIFTSIQSNLYRKKMIQGMLIALLGISIIFFSRNFVNLENLIFLGLPILVIGGSLILFGLIPLRKLTKLEENPNELIVSRKQIHYVAGGKPLFSLPVKALLDMRFIEEANHYGIALSLHDKTGGQIIVHDPKFNLLSFIEKSRKQTGSDLFLPYFGRRSFSRLGFLKQILS